MNLNNWSTLSRRKFISTAAKAALGVGVGAHFLHGQSAGMPKNDMKLIMLYMSGGMSHMDTFDLKPGIPEAGQSKPISTSASGVRISNYLEDLAPYMKYFAVINSMNTTQGAHDKGNYYMHTGYTKRGTIVHPTLGSWAMHHHGKLNQTLPGNIVIGPNSNYPYGGFLPPELGALPIGDPEAGLQNSKIPSWTDEQQYHDQLQLANSFDQAFRTKFRQRQVQAYDKFYAEALSLMRSDDLKAFDIHQESPDTLARYGDSKFGKGCLLARRLLESGVRCIEVNKGGWDSHNGFPEDQQRDLAKALGALMKDLSERGMLRTTVVALTTEFGRNPAVKADSGGRDHWAKAFTCLIGGGPIRGGQVYGKTDKGYEVSENKVTVPELHATIGKAMGMPIKKIVMSESGRPFNVGYKGMPIEALF